MKILVDADACPVKESIVKIAKENDLKVIMVIDNSHILESSYAEIRVVDRSRDSADFAIINILEKGDIVVSQDYGLASISLSKGCYAMNNNGYEYTLENIDRLLFERHLNQKTREAGLRHKGPAKRTADNNISFEKGFRALINRLNHSIDSIDIGEETMK